MRGSVSAPQRDQFYFKLKATSPDPADAAKSITNSHFAVQKKNAQGEIVNDADDKAVSGYIVRLAHSTYIYDDVEQKVLNVFLSDGKEAYKVELNIDSQLGRNVANTLLTLTQDIERLHWRCYNKKDAVSKVLYAKVWIGKTDNKEDGLDWKYTIDEVNPYIDEVEDQRRPGKMIKLYNRLNQKLWDEYLALEKTLNPHYRSLEENRQKLADLNKEELEKEEKLAGESQSVTNIFASKLAEGTPVTTQPPVEAGSGEGASDDLPF